MITCRFEDGDKAELRHVVVHGIIAENNKLLLVKRAETILEGGKWGIISGFLNRDETATQGVIREIKEETGWECEITHLFRINTQPFRPNDRDRQSVAIEFLLKPLRKTGTPDRESTQVAWIPFAKLAPFSRFAFDHGETIRLYLEYREYAFPLPFLV